MHCRLATDLYNKHVKDNWTTCAETIQINHLSCGFQRDIFSFCAFWNESELRGLFSPQQIRLITGGDSGFCAFHLVVELRTTLHSISDTRAIYLRLFDSIDFRLKFIHVHICYFRHAIQSLGTCHFPSFWIQVIETISTDLIIIRMELFVMVVRWSSTGDLCLLLGTYLNQH